MIMGVKKKYQHLGLTTLMYTELKKTMLKNPQIEEMEMSWILENNFAMNHAIHRFGSTTPTKTYRLYELSV